MTHTNTEQPEALRLVEMYDFGNPAVLGNAWKSAVCVELCRLHARVQELEAERDEADRRAGCAERHLESHRRNSNDHQTTASPKTQGRRASYVLGKAKSPRQP